MVDIKKTIRNIENFPTEGVIFRDLTPLFQDKESLKAVADSLYDIYKDKKITKIVGIESRGFIMGGILAAKLNAGFVLIRKAGKLPAESYQISYQKEYGFDTLEIHKDALNENDTILIHDDILATGGTIKAAYELCNNFAIKDIQLNFIAELTDLKGREFLGNEISDKITSLISY